MFLGRTVIIDAGHGGKDSGASLTVRLLEKQLTLAVALKLKTQLKKLGLNSFVIRGQDTDVSQAERQSLANRSNGDLLISLHAGGSSDDTLEGLSCLVCDPGGISFDSEFGGKLAPFQIYTEWSQSSRFDLARFLAAKVRDRAVKHISVRDRGVRALPLLPLRFLIMPSIIVEMGMLSNPGESSRLASGNYQDAMARSIANGIADFFNAIRLNN